MAMDYKSSMMNDDEIVGHLKNVANLLREEMLQQRSWSFTGSFSNFENPSLLQFFMSHLLFGSHVVKVSGIRDQEVDKTVDVSCQFLVQNTRTDRQVKHQTKKDSAGCKACTRHPSHTHTLHTRLHTDTLLTHTPAHTPPSHTHACTHALHTRHGPWLHASSDVCLCRAVTSQYVPRAVIYASAVPSHPNTCHRAE
ncbi:hypothetical protein GWK47_014630 [Chionoecetes opilio]|uniref:Uncharacterized protein n=1 Tax=Chionoecetes opilio TaxID=41210 RepID=A0A8J4XUK4_CHIOP|nr:hypothetical protein GWK47_014630 [Chionoecetes opilio]